MMNPSTTLRAGPSTRLRAGRREILVLLAVLVTAGWPSLAAAQKPKAPAKDATVTLEISGMT
jgi:hypothetical protein